MKNLNLDFKETLFFLGSTALIIGMIIFAANVRNPRHYIIHQYDLMTLPEEKPAALYAEVR